jgi:hypothetical protein
MNNQTPEVSWPVIAEHLEALGARLGVRAGGDRIWHVPHPSGGTFAVEITLRPRWCSLAVDRWRTTDRPEEARQWFEANVWPAVAPNRAGVLPSGNPTYSSAHPIARGDLLEVLDAWVAQELLWSTSARENARP